MTQIYLTHGGVDVYDVALDEDTAHLQLDDTEATAVLIALGTDLRATAGEAQDASDLGGSWHDTYYDDTPVGSLLWTLKGRQATPDVLALAEQYTRAALARWTDKGYTLTWSATPEAPNTLRCAVTLAAPDGRQVDLTLVI